MKGPLIIDTRGKMKKMILELRWILIVGSMLISGCYYDNVTDLYPNGCNTTDVSYSQNIDPILSSNCLSCHNELSQQGGITLHDYENVLIYVENGRLMGSIEHAGGFEPMPLTGGKLSSCQIMKFQSWIDAGALDN